MARLADAIRWKRTIGLGGQLAMAFVAIALLSVASVGLWAKQIIDSQFGAYLDRVRYGDVAWISEQPPEVREVVLQGLRASKTVSLFKRSKRQFLTAFEQSLWMGGASAAALAVVAGVVLARRLARPLQQFSEAAADVAAGNFTQRVQTAGASEIAHMAEAFNTMAARLQENERMRQELLAAIAHELRTPLAIVQANLEAFLDGIAEPTPEQLAALHTQSELLSRLITDLRDLSLAEAGRLALQRAPTDLAALWRAAVETMQPWIDERGVRVAVEHEGDPVADVDPDRMRQVIQNLLANAIRFTPAGGQVRIRLTRAAGSLVTVVEDDGPGISPADLPRIFDSFYRGDPSRSRATGGSGLGLAVVKHLVRAHGGTITAENRAEGGSRFTVELPA